MPEDLVNLIVPKVVYTDVLESDLDEYSFTRQLPYDIDAATLKFVLVEELLKQLHDLDVPLEDVP